MCKGASEITLISRKPTGRPTSNRRFGGKAGNQEGLLSTFLCSPCGTSFLAFGAPTSDAGETLERLSGNCHPACLHRVAHTDAPRFNVAFELRPRCNVWRLVAEILDEPIPSLCGFVQLMNQSQVYVGLLKDAACVGSLTCI